MSSTDPEPLTGQAGKSALDPAAHGWPLAADASPASGPPSPLVSVIVRTRNRRRSLEECLQGLKAQTWQDFEVILINDGGEDVADLVAKVSPPLRVTYRAWRPSRGRPQALNAGLREAMGEYISYLDDDDICYPDHLETLVTALRSSNYRIAYTDIVWAFQRLTPNGTYETYERRQLHARAFDPDWLLFENYIPNNAIMHARACLKAVGPFDEAFDVLEDWELWIRLAQQYDFCHIGKCTAEYRKRDDSSNITDAPWKRELFVATTARLFAKYARERERAAQRLFEQTKRELGEREQRIACLEAALAAQGARQEEEGRGAEVVQREREALTQQVQALTVELEREWGRVQALDHDLERGYQRAEVLERDLAEAVQRTQVMERESDLLRSQLTRIHSSPLYRLLDLEIKDFKEAIRRFAGFVVLISKTADKIRRRIASKNSIPTNQPPNPPTSTEEVAAGDRSQARGPFRRQRGNDDRGDVNRGEHPDAPRSATSTQPVDGTWRAGVEARPGWYQTWIAENEPDEGQLAVQRQAAKGLAYKPLISIITPVYNTPPEILDEAIRSVTDQTYENWELCLVDGHSDRHGVKEVLEKWAGRDKRVRIKFLNQNLGISGNSNEALKITRGEFLALLDSDDVLAPFALFEVARFLNEMPCFDIVYSDEDKIDPDGRRITPFFKPEWSPDLLQCFMYIGHLTVYRHDLVQSLNGFRSEFELSQDYDLALRATEKTNRIGHISKVLYHWRALAGSAAAGQPKPFARKSNLAALASAVERRGYVAEILEYPTANRAKFKLQRYPLVSIIVPTDHEKNIFVCLEASLLGTAYPAFEIVIVTNTTLASRIARKYADDTRIRTVLFDAPFNFSAKCNMGAKEAKGEYLLFLNDDVHPLDEAWIGCMLGYFQDDGVGAVSPKMVYSNGLVQHAGLVTGVRGFVGTAFHQEPRDSTAYFNLLQSTRTVSALSAACLLMRREIFDLVGGFDDINTPIMHSDVDLCFKIRTMGLRLVYTPFTTLKHVGHVSLGELETEQGHSPATKADVYLLKRWGEYLSHDPYYTDNMRDLLYRDSPVPYRMYASNQRDTIASRGDILFVSHDLSLSGAPIIVEILARHMVRDGYFATIVAPITGPLLEQCRLDGIPTIIDPLIYESPSALQRLIEEYDVVVANTIQSWGVVHVAKSLGKQVIWFVHESNFGRDLAERNETVRRALAMADAVVFPSHQTQFKYHKFGHRENFVTLHYGIEKTEPRNGTLLEQSNRIRVVSVGSIEHRKGQDVLVRSISGMPRDLIDSFEFYFIGRVQDAGYYDSLKEKTRTLKNVHWVGEISHNESLEYISNSNVLVCTSRDDPSPIVVIEGMSQGKAIVSTPVGVIPEIIEHNGNGLLVGIEDYEGVAECLARLYQDRSLLEQLGNAARRRFEERLTIERYTRDVVNIVCRGASNSRNLVS